MPRVSRLTKHPRYDEVMQMLWEETITLSEAARILGTSEQNLWHHLNMYLQGLEEDLDKYEQKEKEEPVEFTQVLQDLIRDLHAQVKELMKVPIEDRPTSLIRELRGAITDLAALEGKFSNQPMIQLNKITMQFDKLTSFLYSKLCPKCQRLVAEYVSTLVEDAEGLEGKE